MDGQERLGDSGRVTFRSLSERGGGGSLQDPVCRGHAVPAERYIRKHRKEESRLFAKCESDVTPPPPEKGDMG